MRSEIEKWDEPTVTARLGGMEQRLAGWDDSCLVYSHGLKDYTLPQAEKLDAKARGD